MLRIIVLTVPLLLASLQASASNCIYVSTFDGIAVIDADAAPAVLVRSVDAPYGDNAPILVDQSRLRAYVQSAGHTTRFQVLDLATNATAAVVSYSGAPWFTARVLGPDGTLLYGLAPGPTTESEALASVEIATGAVTTSSVDVTSTNRAPPFMDITPDGKYLYVGIEHPPFGLEVVDAATLTVVGTVSGLTYNPFALAISPDGRRVYTLGPFNTVSVVDTESNAVVDSITIKNCRTIHDVERNCGSDNLAVSPDGSRLYVANYTDESIGVVDTATDTELYSIKLDDPNLLGDNHLPCEESNPDFIAVSPDGRNLAIRHSLANDCMPQPNFLWVDFGQKVTFSDSPIPVFSSVAIASVPSGCAGGPVPCAGDCDGSGTVTVDELVTGVHIALGEQSYVNCLALDADHNGQVTVDELTGAVDTALNGCTAPTPIPAR